MSPSKTQPALLGGVAMGVLSALPFVNLVNCACCAWLIIGGVMASYLMQQNHPEPVQVGDGAIVGLLAGIVGAFVATVIGIPLSSMTSGFQQQMVEQMIANAGDLPPEVRSAIEGMGAGGAGAAVTIASAIFYFFFMLIFCSAFGMVGGMLGAMMFKKNAPPPPPPPSFTPGGFTPGGFGSHVSHGEHTGHTFRPPTFTPPPPPGSTGQ